MRPSLCTHDTSLCTHRRTRVYTLTHFCVHMIHPYVHKDAPDLFIGTSSCTPGTFLCTLRNSSVTHEGTFVHTPVHINVHTGASLLHKNMRLVHKSMSLYTYWNTFVYTKMRCFRQQNDLIRQNSPENQ
jgi:hypothetical protein